MPQHFLKLVKTLKIEIFSQQKQLQLQRAKKTCLNYNFPDNINPFLFSFSFRSANTRRHQHLVDPDAAKQPTTTPTANRNLVEIEHFDLEIHFEDNCRMDYPEWGGVAKVED
jgi:hypothetical protein